MRAEGIEPSTHWLKASCSTTELRPHTMGKIIQQLTAKIYYNSNMFSIKTKLKDQTKEKETSKLGIYLFLMIIMICIFTAVLVVLVMRANQTYTNFLDQELEQETNFIPE